MSENLATKIELAIKDSEPSLRPSDMDLPLVYAVKETKSTMDLARQYLDEVQPNQWLIVLSEKQTAGRGRLGRVWEGKHSGLYTTLAVSCHLNKVDLSGFSLVVGLSILQALEIEGLKLKWPNDILSADGKKLGGVLIETLNRAERLWILIGIGLNLAGDLPEELNAITLKQLGFEPEIDKLLSKLYLQLWNNWKIFESQGFSAFKTLWLSNYIHLQQDVRVQIGDTTITGRAVDLAEDGSLIIKTEDGQIKSVTVGDVNAI